MVGEICVRASTTHLSKPVFRLRAATAMANHHVNTVESSAEALTGFIDTF
jgi:hypothetical protein